MNFVRPPRLFLLLVALFLMADILVSLPASMARAAPHTIPQIFRDVKSLPGVTREEIAAIEALREKYPVLIYGMLASSETFIREDGSVGGYSALFCDWMSELFGIRFEVRVYDWPTLRKKVDDKEIAFTGELNATPERRKKYLMSGPFTERAITAFRMRQSEPLGAIKARKARCLFLAGSTTFDLVMPRADYGIEPLTAATKEDALLMLRAGEADAFITEEHVVSTGLDETLIRENVFPVVYSSVSLATAIPELEPLIRVFDRLLRAGAMEHLIALYTEGNEDYLRHMLRTRLTPEEKEYLAMYRNGGLPVLVAAESDTYPSSFYNWKERQWQGISIDILRKIRQLTGLNFEFASSGADPWHKLLARLEAGDVHMITELIYSGDRKDRFLWADEPYAEDSYALISRAEYEDVSIKHVLYAKVGLIKNSAYADVFREWFPDHKDVIEYEDSSMGFKGLEDGKVDLLMASRSILLTATHYHEKVGYKANLIFDRSCTSSFGFHKDQHLLRSIVSKAQSVIDTRAIADRWNRKVFDYRSKMARAQLPYLWGVSGLLVCVLGLAVVVLLRNRQMNVRLERTVKERTAELEIQTRTAFVASQAKGDFLSRMSHEIRTPLNAIIGMAQVARQTAALESSKTLAPINEMIAASSHLLGILNDVLDMSKIEAGKFSLSHEAFSLVSALRGVENIIVQRCLEKNIKFVADVDDFSDVAIKGDPLRLKQVLINLLGNAVKFTNTGGTISLSVRVLEETEKDVVLRFSVTDTGIGMTPEQKKKLFIAFEQADSSIAARFGGTGLGLTISQNLINQMGGEITVASEQNKGSTFSFTLMFPKTSGAPAEEAPGFAEGLNLESKRLLLVEDIPINRQILIALLEDTNLIIDEAEDGVAAVQAVESSPPGYYDLIFMDIQMPRMDGYEAARRIRKLNRPDAATLPIIAMTANAYREDIERCFAAGMNSHVSKPVNIDVIKRLLGKIFAHEADG